MCFKDGLWQLPYNCFKVAPPGNEIKSRVSFLCVKFLLSAWAVAELWLLSVGCCEPGVCLCGPGRTFWGWLELLPLACSLPCPMQQGWTESTGSSDVIPPTCIMLQSLSQLFYVFSQKGDLIFCPAAALPCVIPSLLFLLTMVSN